MVSSGRLCSACASGGTKAVHSLMRSWMTPDLSKKSSCQGCKNATVAILRVIRTRVTRVKTRGIINRRLKIDARELPRGYSPGDELVASALSSGLSQCSSLSPLLYSRASHQSPSFLTPTSPGLSVPPIPAARSFPPVPQQVKSIWKHTPLISGSSNHLKISPYSYYLVLLSKNI